MPRTARVKTLIKGAVSVALLGALLCMLDWRYVLSLLGKARLLPALLSLLSVPVLILLSSYKWKVLLDAQGVRLSLRQLSGYYWIGFFLSNFLPSSVGGDVARLAFLRGSGRVSVAAASIFVERLSGFAVLLLISLAGLVARPQYFNSMGLLPVLWLVAGGFAVCLLGLVLGGGRMLSWLERLPAREGTGWGRVVVKVRQAVGAALFYRDQHRPLLLCLVVSLVFYALRIAMQYGVLLSLGFDLPFLEVAFIAPMIDLVTALPVSLNGLGLTEGAFVLFFGAAGLLSEEALAVAVLARFVLVLPSSVGGIILLFHRGGEGCLRDDGS